MERFAEIEWLWINSQLDASPSKRESNESHGQKRINGWSVRSESLQDVDSFALLSYLMDKRNAVWYSERAVTISYLIV